MSFRAITLLLGFLWLVAACDRGEVSAARWRAMSHSEKSLIVKSLLGAETVAARKGGTEARYSGTVNEYIDRIDAAYASGDDRAVESIWKELADGG